VGRQDKRRVTGGLRDVLVSAPYGRGREFEEHGPLEVGEQAHIEVTNLANHRRIDPVHLHPRSTSGRVVDPGARPIAEREVVTRVGGPVGELVRLEGEQYYRISGYDRMRPFLMTLPSDTDLWMFVTSQGGLTAGRVDADGSIFPYETVDKLHDGHHHTGPVTLLRARRADGEPVTWEPFSGQGPAPPGVERNLYKSAIGNRLIFEEVNRGLGLVFRYRWVGCDEFGWVRTATLENCGASPVEVELLDGLRNVLPYGIPHLLSQNASNLADAYKRSEVDERTGMGVFALTAGISDRPEAVEVLRANTVWSIGLEDFGVHLSGQAVEAFRSGGRPVAEAVLRGRRGNYLITATVRLAPAEYAQWLVVADAGRSQAQVAALLARIEDGRDLLWEIEERLAAAGENIRRIVGSADGIQVSAHAEVAVHHFANVLFNSMRGGVFADNYTVPTADLSDFISLRNGPVARRQRAFLDSLPQEVPMPGLLESADGTGDADLERLCREYLPLYFGRRHGDPSRPWNRFTIHVRNSDGSRSLHYEGNWRDIFQNWEALCLSFPEFLPNVVAKFVNASTVDGFNPYRISRDGVDWETPDPDDPWSHIGYWGDHQIIYLLKLLEWTARFLPGRLRDMLRREIFSYADVPYRIRSYGEILTDPRSTIDFDAAADARIAERVAVMGTDGKLLQDADSGVYHTNLFEKLLVPLLSKLSNLVPDGGIWLNTQRPEWNDANNALVGNGVSVVTLCYLRRYVAFLDELLSGGSDTELAVSTEVFEWFRRIASTLHRDERLLGAAPLGDVERKRILDELGLAFSDYRRDVYTHGFTGTVMLAVEDAIDLCRTARAFIDRGIRANRRDDGLYNSYLLLELSEDGARAALRPLPEMLEGQVAVLSSGLLGPAEAAEVLRSLFSSALYREDQASFMLYPEKKLPSFMNKNVLAPASVSATPLLRDLLELGEDSIIARDASGVVRFHPDFRNGHDLAAALDRLAEREEWTDAVARDRGAVMDLFEDVFKHSAYTGRSGAMYSYEGLGCVYWHMVAKLLVAAQEAALSATDDDTDGSFDELAGLYSRIRSGLGYEKSPGEYGAFPTDPYSHTPAHGGAKQPGMTGQVKEEILTRLGELGVHVEDGIVSFRPVLLEPDEFLTDAAVFSFVDVEGEPASLDLEAGSMAFTVCQVPVVYRLVEGEGSVRVVMEDGSERAVQEDGQGRGSLGREVSAELLGRTGRIVRIAVGIAAGPVRSQGDGPT
jgi:hypothetical protein